MEDFLIRALIAGLLLSCITGPVGSLIVWKRESFFGDALAHSSLIGIAVAVFLDIDQIVGVFAFCMLFAWLLSLLVSKNIYSGDALLAVLSHSALALGVILVSVMGEVYFNLEGFLFGDILAVGVKDIYYILAGVVLCYVAFFAIWPKLLLTIIDRDIAVVEGIKVKKIDFIFSFLTSCVIALSIKIVGVLLVTSLLVIPAVSARSFAKTPEKMAFMAIVFGMVSVVLGLYISSNYDTSAGASIVLASAVVFILANVRDSIWSRR